MLLFFPLDLSWGDGDNCTRVANFLAYASLGTRYAYMSIDRLNQLGGNVKIVLKRPQNGICSPAIFAFSASRADCQPMTSGHLSKVNQLN